MKKLVESVKNNAQFLNVVKNKHNSDSLANFFANKTPQEVITIVKRFEFDNLPENEREAEKKKMKEYYQMKENETLTDEQINEYLYKKAIGEITSQSPQNPTDDSKKGNKVLKVLLIIGAVVLVVVIVALIVIWIRKNKEKSEIVPKKK